MLKHTEMMDRKELSIEARKMGITTRMEQELYALIRLLIAVELEGFRRAFEIFGAITNEDVLQYIKDGHAVEPYRWLKKISGLCTMKVAFGIPRSYMHLIGYLVRDHYDIDDSGFARGVTEGPEFIGAPKAAADVYKLFSRNIKLNKEGKLGGSKLSGKQRRSILVQGFNSMFVYAPLDENAPVPELHGVES